MLTSLMVTVLPISYEVEKINNTYAGFLIDLLNIITDELNLTYTLIEPRDRQWGVQLENGSWTGLIRDLVDERADLALSELTNTKERLEYVDFTTFLRMSSFVVASYDAPVEYGSSIFAPFHIEIWRYIFAAVMLSVIMCFIKIRFQIPQSFLTNHLRPECIDIGVVCLDIIGSLFRQSMSKLTTSSHKWFMSFWMIFLFFISSSYISTIYVHLVAGKVPIKIDSVEQLMELEDPKIYLIEGTASIDIIRTSKRDLYEKIWRSVTKGRGQVIKPGSWYKDIQAEQYIITTRPVAEERRMEGYSIYIGKTVFNSMQFCFAMRKTLPGNVKNGINKVITKLHVSGIYLALLKKHKLSWKLKNRERIKQNMIHRISKNEKRALSLNDLFSIFILFLIGIIGSICVLTTEKIYQAILTYFRQHMQPSIYLSRMQT